MNDSAYIGRPGDFDFLVGRWEVRHRCLRERLVGCTEWHEFTGLQQAWSHLGGIVSVDEVRCETEGWSGLTVRTLDLATRQWSIHWVHSRRGVLEPPVHGGWDGDRGVFEGEDTDQGRPVHVRFLWERLSPDRARWSQSFSLRGSSESELNWVMDFTRLP